MTGETLASFFPQSSRAAGVAIEIFVIALYAAREGLDRRLAIPGADYDRFAAL
jgi:hypothetical protein